MEDESDHDDLMNFCADLVTLRRTEAFPLRLLRDQGPGQWVLVNDVCQQSGITTGEGMPRLVAAWLPDPLGDEAYVVIIFFDDETKQSFAAHYNKRRLLDVNPVPTETTSEASGRKGSRAGKVPRGGTVPGAALGAGTPRRRRPS